MRAVIFDFDGTIADSFATVIGIAYKLTKRPELADLTQMERMKANNVGLRQAVKNLNIPRWHSLWLLPRGRILMSRQIHQIPLFTGMDQVLKELAAQKFELYIVSSNSTANVERFMLEKGLLPYFKRVYGGAGLFDKARLIKKVLKAENLAPSTVVYVGDEVRDIEASKQVGMPCVAVAWGYNSADLLIKYSPTVIVRSPKQLLNVLSQWGTSL